MSVAAIYASPRNFRRNTCSLQVCSSSLEFENSNTASASIIVLPEFNLVKPNAQKAQSQEWNTLEPQNILRLSFQKSSSNSTLSLIPFGIQKLGSVASLASSTISRSALTPSQRLRAESGELCAICLDYSINEEQELYTIANCSHTFHDTCIRRWKEEEATCPLCRGPLPEELGITGSIKQDEFSDMIQRILDWLTLENENVITRRDKITNFFLTPVGLAWSLLMIPLLLIIETLCLFLISPVALTILTAQTCNESFNHCFELLFRLGLIIFLTLICIVLLGIIIFTLQIPFLFYIVISFCFEVFRCKRKWQDSHFYTVRKLIIGSMYTCFLENVS